MSTEKNNLYFIHGWLSSPTGEKAQLFKEHLNAEPLSYRDCDPQDINVDECINTLQQTLEGKTDITLIGSSLGGLLSAHLALHNKNITKLILLNPAIIPPDMDLKTLPTGIPLSILQGMQKPALYSENINAAIYIINGNHDEVVPPEWAVRFARKQQATIHFLDDDHRLSKHMPMLCNLIKKHL